MPKHLKILLKLGLTVKLIDIIIETLYHIGGISLVYFSIKTLQYSWSMGTYPSILGVVVITLAGYYTGDVVKNIYNVTVKKKKYPLGLNL